MNIVAELKERFRPAVAPLVADPEALLDMIRPTQNVSFGDYQMNCAMPLEKRLGRPAQEIATDLVADLKIDDLCESPQVAGKGFINLKLRTSWIEQQLEEARRDERLGVLAVTAPQTIIVDFSSPNVAKPMHVGHIRSTVIGDAISRMLLFRGHRVIRDNHLGDWGTQFGMILYGMQNFSRQADYEENPVRELSRLYRLVRKLMDYHESTEKLPRRQMELQKCEATLTKAQAARNSHDPADKAGLKKTDKELRRIESQCREFRDEIRSLQDLLSAIDGDVTLSGLTQTHPDICDSVLRETALLHASDPARLERWREILPKCREDIQRTYDRLNIQFDVELGESFYHDRLDRVVKDLEARDLARKSDGATCVFLPDFEAPMIVRKRDGAFLYATTDLATIQYRMEMWQPDAILYVVDFRQGEHFDKLFAVARNWGYEQVHLQHIKFGTVLGDDGRPFKTRAGDSVGLEGLLDEAVTAAAKVVEENDLQKEAGPDFTPQERASIANIVGHAAIKYADLSQNRESDYVYQQEKMVAMKGNTATYMQYSFARIQNIFAKGLIDIQALRQDPHSKIRLLQPAERALGLQLLRFEQALDEALEDYRPHLMTEYLFDLAKNFSDFYNDCPVLRAEEQDERISRLLLCDLVGRTIGRGLELLGISVVDRM
ncbi:MAG: arginine--tRNA ligase [Planctomycetota bacterium]|nr:arginine--tRNA ligase [Planctomycetota bacterium]MDA1180070.1 arginine--tRNA ligase [Planctomycetota bacterium]